jgi:hypothetical protein
VVRRNHERNAASAPPNIGNAAANAVGGAIFDEGRSVPRLSSGETATMRGRVTVYRHEPQVSHYFTVRFQACLSARHSMTYRARFGSGAKRALRRSIGRYFLGRVMFLVNPARQKRFANYPCHPPPCEQARSLRGPAHFDRCPRRKTTCGNWAR